MLHTATIAGVLACLMRHFRASLASLPLLAQPLSALPIGTWSPGSSLAAGIAAEDAQQQVGAGAAVFVCFLGTGRPRCSRQRRETCSLALLLVQTLRTLPMCHRNPPLPTAAQERDAKRPRRQRRVAKLAVVQPDTPLTQALGLLLEAGVSSLPVVDASGVLLDIYARADITTLAKVRGLLLGGSGLCVSC